MVCAPPHSGGDGGPEPHALALSLSLAVLKEGARALYLSHTPGHRLIAQVHDNLVRLGHNERVVPGHAHLLRIQPMLRLAGLESPWPTEHRLR